MQYSSLGRWEFIIELEFFCVADMDYGKISEDTKTYVAFVRESWNDLKKLLQDEDELVVSVTLILSYAYENAEADWKQANSVADGNSFGRKRNTPTVPPYVETLALRSNTDVTIECCGQQFTAHATVLKGKKIACVQLTVE